MSPIIKFLSFNKKINFISIKLIWIFCISLILLSSNLVIFNKATEKIRTTTDNIFYSNFTFHGIQSSELILNISNLAIDEKQQLIKVQVSSNLDYPFPFKYKWKISNDIIVYNEKGLIDTNSLSGELPFIKKNQPVFINLKVSGFNENQNKFIRFEIQSSSIQRPIFSSALIRSQKNKTFEDLVNEVEKYKAESMEK